MSDIRLTRLQEYVLRQLRTTGRWSTTGDIAKGMRTKSPEFKSIRSGQLGGPLRTLIGMGLVEVERRSRKKPIRAVNGTVIFSSYSMYRATDDGRKLIMDE